MKRILIGAALSASIFASSVAFADSGNDKKRIVIDTPSIRSVEGFSAKPKVVHNGGYMLGFPEGLNNNPSEGGHCDGWAFLALSIGWPHSEVEKLSFIIHRESRCNPNTLNDTDPNGGSRGLMQINGFWCRPWKYSKLGWLQERGIVNTCDDLYDPATNLRAALAIFMYGEENHGCGWKNAWATRCSK